VNVVGLPRTVKAFAWLALAVWLLVFAAPAHAIYGPANGGFGAQLASVDNASDEQSNAPSTDADISANGQYVVFQTSATNFFEDDGETPQEREAAEPPGTLREGGIFRYDRETGELQIVASGNLVVDEGAEAGKILLRGAQNPSVSAEGRYVAFVTGQQLAPQDDNDNLDVYVRDMNSPITTDPKTSGAFTLASAQNGSEAPPVYDDSSIVTPIPGGDPGTQLWPNTAISADGRYVLFRTSEVKSSLPEGTTPETEPNQLFVRDLQAKTTTLVTRVTTSGAPAGGAEGPATLSADGSTVAWVGHNAPAQTKFLAGESPNESTPYYLWRRWAEPDALTRRITGISEPECEPEEPIELNPTAEGPCYGPLTYPESSNGSSINAQAPGLSANGDTAAFLAGGSLRPNVLKAEALDLFVTSMSPGVTRKAGTSELTLAVNGAEGNGNASITSLALSSDGTHIAFVSQRNSFVLPEPEPVGSFSATGKQNELYVVDLATNTLERAVIGLQGADPNGSTLNNPTLSADGSAVAFVSQASNLLAGDANGFADAFLAVHQAPAGTAALPAEVNSVQGGFSLSVGSSPELGLQVKHGKNGGFILLVETPGAGKLTAKARGTITTRAGKKTKKAKVTLAQASGTARSEGTTTLVLDISAKYAKDLDATGKLKASISVDFVPPPPAETLSTEAAATFDSVTAKKPARGALKAKAKK
jgi:Tol biopolymer transport system component